MFDPLLFSYVLSIFLSVILLYSTAGYVRMASMAVALETQSLQGNCHTKCFYLLGVPWLFVSAATLEKDYKRQNK